MLLLWYPLLPQVTFVVDTGVLMHSPSILSLGAYYPYDCTHPIVVGSPPPHYGYYASLVIPYVPHPYGVPLGTPSLVNNHIQHITHST